MTSFGTAVRKLMGARKRLSNEMISAVHDIFEQVRAEAPCLSAVWCTHQSGVYVSAALIVAVQLFRDGDTTIEPVKVSDVGELWRKSLPTGAGHYCSGEQESVSTRHGSHGKRFDSAAQIWRQRMLRMSRKTKRTLVGTRAA